MSAAVNDNSKDRSGGLGSVMSACIHYTATKGLTDKRLLEDFRKLGATEEWLIRYSHEVSFNGQQQMRYSLMAEASEAGLKLV